MWDQVWCRVGLIAAASAQEPAFCASNDMHILSLQSSVGCSPERHTREITHMGLTCVLRFLHPAGPGSYEALSAYKVLSFSSPVLSRSLLWPDSNQKRLGQGALRLKAFDQTVHTCLWSTAARPDKPRCAAPTRHWPFIEQQS